MRATFDEVVERFSDSESDSQCATTEVSYFELDPILSRQYRKIARWIGGSQRTGVDASDEARASGKGEEPRGRRAQADSRRARHGIDSDALPDEGERVDSTRGPDTISDSALAQFQAAFGPCVTKTQIFTYAYGVLHWQRYRQRFAADVKELLPRIPLAASLADFETFAEAGQCLMDLHLGHDSVEPWPLTEHITAHVGEDDFEVYAVTATKMRFASATDRSRLIYSPLITISDIPEAVHRYRVGSRSALEWILDRCWITTDKASGIVSDPNDWARDHGNPRYIIDQIARAVRVSVESMRIVDALPALPLAVTGTTVQLEPRALGRGLELTRPGQTLKEAPSDWTPESIPEDMDRDEWRDWCDSLPEEVAHQRRDDVLIAGLEAGYTLQEMGDAFGISRERARQIAARNGVSIKELRRAQKAQVDRRRRRVARHIFGLSLTHPELTIEEIADWFETDVPTVRSALEHRRAVHETRINTGDHARTSDEDLIAALSEWGAQSQSLTGDDYTSWAAARGLPGKQTIATRFTSWNAALTVAGLGGRVRDRGGVRPVISDEEMWASVVDFLRSDLDSFGFASYDSWARSRGLPVGPSVRKRLGEWSHIHATARKVLRYCVDRDGTWDFGESILDVVPGEAPRNRVTRQDALESLTRVAPLIAGPLTVTGYEAVREDSDAPAHLIAKRCGSWIRAILDSGLEERLSAKAKYRLAHGLVEPGEEVDA